MIANTTGIILAGGSATRFREGHGTLHKSLIPIQGKPLLGHIQEHFHRAGIADVYTVTGEFHRELSEVAMKPVLNEAWDSVNIMGSLLSIPLEKLRDHLVVSYSDVYYEASLLSHLVEIDHPVVIPSVSRWREVWEMRFENPTDDVESFEYDSEGFLVDIGRKVNRMDAVMGQFAGLFKISKSLLQASIAHFSAADLKKMDVTTFFRKALEAELFSVKVMPFQGEWFEFDSQSDLRTYQTNYYK